MSKKGSKKVSMQDYIDNYNPKLTRRGTKMSFGYLYRLIRQDIEGTIKKPLWFKYELEGEKKRIWILID